MTFFPKGLLGALLLPIALGPLAEAGDQLPVVCGDDPVTLLPVGTVFTTENALGHKIRESRNISVISFGSKMQWGEPPEGGVINVECTFQSTDIHPAQVWKLERPVEALDSEDSKKLVFWLIAKDKKKRERVTCDVRAPEGKRSLLEPSITMENWQSMSVSSLLPQIRVTDGQKCRGTPVARTGAT